MKYECCVQNLKSIYFYKCSKDVKIHLTYVLLVVVMLHLNIVTKATASKDVKSGDVHFDVGNLFTNKQDFSICEHMLQ